MTAVAIHLGLGRHEYYLLQSPQQQGQLSHVLKLLFIAIPTFTPASTAIRASVGVFLLRIFNTRKSWRLSLYILMAFNLATGVACTIAFFFLCTPFRKLWMPNTPGTCLGIRYLVSVGRFYGGLFHFAWHDPRYGLTVVEAASLLCDWILATMPIGFLWKIQMSHKNKAAICALMGMGFM